VYSNANEKPWSIKPSLAWSANICDCCLIGYHSEYSSKENRRPPVHRWFPQEPLKGSGRGVQDSLHPYKITTSKDSPQLTHISINWCRAGRFFHIMDKLHSTTDWEAFKKPIGRCQPYRKHSGQKTFGQGTMCNKNLHPKLISPNLKCYAPPISDPGYNNKILSHKHTTTYSYNTQNLSRQLPILFTHRLKSYIFHSYIFKSLPEAMTSFRPHRLIRSLIQQQFYNRAHIANVYTRIADPKKHKTVALIKVVLYKNIFTKDYFAVTSEQPASTTSKRHYDIIIKYLKSGSENIQTLCFAKYKHTNKSQAFSLKALEAQAADYCKLYLKDQKVSFVYTTTIASAHVRL
jgi:hypothetical protein